MATLPSGRTWVTNDEPTAKMFNTDLRDAYAFFWNPPRVRVYRATSQTIPSSGVSATLLTWDTETFDSDGMHASGSPSRLTVVTAGIYEVTLHMEYQVRNVVDNGHRFVAVHKNNASAVVFGSANEIGYDHAIQADNDTSGAPQTNHLTFLHSFAAADYIEATCYSTCNTTVATHEVSADRTFFQMIWLGTA